MKIDKQYFLPLPTAKIYDAWISSGTVISPATAMDINPIVGGHYRLIIDGPEFQSKCDGIFSIVEPQKRVCYSWQWDGDDEETEIDVSFTPTADGTKIDIEHSGFVSQQSFENHDSGWDTYINGFAAHLGVTARKP